MAGKKIFFNMDTEYWTIIGTIATIIGTIATIIGLKQNKKEKKYVGTLSNLTPKNSIDGNLSNHRLKNVRENNTNIKDDLKTNINTNKSSKKKY
jgi:hypothetical protein